MANTARLTPEARRSDAAALVAERRERIGQMASEARRVLVGARAVLDVEIAALLAVTPEELAAAERTLRPILNAAAQNPEMLLNLYRARHLDGAQRLLIEETAAALIDALGDSDNYAFGNSWNALQQELAAERGPEEVEANARVRELDALAEYVDAAEAVAVMDLALMDPAREASTDQREQMLIGRQMSEAVVNAYENEHAVQALA
jgi:hypothetical protein